MSTPNVCFECSFACNLGISDAQEFLNEEKKIKKLDTKLINKLWDIEVSNSLNLNFMYLTTENK